MCALIMGKTKRDIVCRRKCGRDRLRLTNRTEMLHIGHLEHKPWENGGRSGGPRLGSGRRQATVAVQCRRRVRQSLPPGVEQGFVSLSATAGAGVMAL